MGSENYNLRLDDTIRRYQLVAMGDRDCEKPNLMEFLRIKRPVKSLLDVGCAFSHLSYASEIRAFIQNYEGIDIKSCTDTVRILDKYHVGNVNTYDFEGQMYDGVISVGAIEHAGLSTYKGAFRRERRVFFYRLLESANNFVWLSFPVGPEYITRNDQGHPDACAITEDDLEFFEISARRKGWQYKERFFYSQGLQAKHPWYEHKNKELALKIPYIDFIGNQSNCIMELSRKKG